MKCDGCEQINIPSANYCIECGGELTPVSVIDDEDAGNEKEFVITGWHLLAGLVAVGVIFEVISGAGSGYSSKNCGDAGWDVNGDWNHALYELCDQNR